MSFTPRIQKLSINFQWPGVLWCVIDDFRSWIKVFRFMSWKEKSCNATTSTVRRLEFIATSSSMWRKGAKTLTKSDEDVSLDKALSREWKMCNSECFRSGLSLNRMDGLFSRSEQF